MCESRPAMTINDSPRFRWRGLMLDSARHYQSPEFIKRFIDAMAMHKLNVLHWHLTDDQAWRLEIQKYPKLTEVGAWRVPAGQAPQANIDPKTNSHEVRRLLSADDVRDIVAYAAARHITIVPEIEMPGHASARDRCISASGCRGAIASHAVPADWGVYPNLYNVNDSTFAFLEDVLTKCSSSFRANTFTSAAMRPSKINGRLRALVQARMKALGSRG